MPKHVKPISPDEVVGKLEEAIPPNVIQAINNVIAKNWNGSSAHFRVSDVLDELNKLKAYDDLEIKSFPSNFTPIYERAGWKIDVDRPGYCESYETNWTFTKSGVGKIRIGER